MSINIWAVLAAAVSSFALGGLWYSPASVLAEAWKAGLLVGVSYHTSQFVPFGLILGAWH